MAARQLVLVAVFSSYTLSEAGSSFFVGDFKNIIQTTIHAYPIDVCVNTEIIALGTQADHYVYHKYTCNEDGTELTATNYGSDSCCSYWNAGDSTVYDDTTLTQGDQFSFNCSGASNYVSYANFIGDDSCCDTSLGVGQFATAVTDLCWQYRVSDEGETVGWVKYGCVDGAIARQGFNTSECDIPLADNNTLAIDNMYFNTTCAFWKTFPFVGDIYRAVDFCVENGNVSAANAWDECAALNETACPSAPANTTDSGDDSGDGSDDAMNRSLWRNVIGMAIVSLLLH